MSEPLDLQYQNKFTFNQRGGAIEINNSTEREEVQISQFSGSNILLSNVVTSELATNNKQTKVLFDEFKTVGHTLNEFTGKDRNTRTGENTYDIKGAQTQTEINAFTTWREAYRDLANINAEFWINRGGISYPTIEEPVVTALSGTRAPNPDLNVTRLIVENNFSGYSGIPTVTKDTNEVTSYVKVPDAGKTIDANTKSPTPADIVSTFGETGSRAPGVIQYGGVISSATQDGEWNSNTDKQELKDNVIERQPSLLDIEKQMGNGGDEIEFVKRHKITNIGASINNYPSVRVDKQGRSQTTEIGVAATGTFLHNDFTSHVEVVDNSSTYPCGNHDLVVANKYNVVVGSGGVQIKTSGPLSLNGTDVRLGAVKLTVSSSDGTTIGSETSLDLLAPKIQIRSNRQVLVDSALGVKNNLIVGGAFFVEGELYVNHITAPIEAQETEPTKVYGEPVSGKIIGYAGDVPVIGVATPDSIVMYNHTHHFNNIPLTLLSSNSDVRTTAQQDGINNPVTLTAARKQDHARKG